MGSVSDLLIHGLCLKLTKILAPVVPLSTIQWKVYNRVLCFFIIYLLDNDISGGSSIIHPLSLTRPLVSQAWYVLYTNCMIMSQAYM